MTPTRAYLAILILFGLSTVQAADVEPFKSLPSGGQVELFSIHGSNTVGAELGPNLVMAYLEAKGATDIEMRNLSRTNEKVIAGIYKPTRTRIEIPIAAHGSGTGFKGLASGMADIAAASRPAKDKEVTLLKGVTNLRSPASEHIIGIDGLAIVVNPANPISELSVDELSEIFSGGYTDWSQLGGRPGAIQVYARDENSGTWDSFKGMVLGKGKTLVANAQRYESNSELSDRVASDQGGIGFVALSSVRDSKLIAVSDGSAKALKPNKLTVATEDYALSRRLYMYTNESTNNKYVLEFMNFVQQDQGQKVVGNTGFISQELKAVVPEFYGELPQDFQALTNDAKRLTINFRFHEGSARLDNKAMKDIERLVDYLHQSDSQQKEIVLIGFGDKKKSERRSKLLSKLRAMAVRRELVRNGIYPQESVGYGEYLPVASANRAEGRMKNRRVEVWLK